jgi:sucrose-6-phosphate hydrolase SacC (GH32 family)
MPRFVNSLFHFAWLFFAAVMSVAPTLAQVGNEPFRPRFHFTPERNWMNDPNGMVYYEGEYHLFYQYNPFGNKWGHMSWGHAVSKDLVRWEHLPVALQEENGVMIFSGSAVIDWKNTSGFGKDGKPPMVAIYTGHRDKHQDQQIAYSNDRGRTWTKYEKNPVLDIGLADFRDPKVFWHEPTSRWVMVVAIPVERKVHLYASKDLKSWEKLSDFGPAGAVSGIWECPDLFPVPVEGARGTTKWMLIVNVGSDAPAGGSGCQYFVGDFDGTRFVADVSPNAVKEEVPNGKLIADFEGADYAGWKVEGDAFGPGPAKGALKGQQPVGGFRGAGLVNSYFKGDDTEGILTSMPFELSAGYVNFLIGGGAYAGETCVNLLIDGKAVRTAAGRENEHLGWHSWDVRDLRGKSASFQIVDKRKGHWGHVNVDHVMLADAPARGGGAEQALWADFGPDFYAAVSWSDIPKSDGRRLWLGWMSSWPYAGDVPTSPWRSAMTVPRELMVRRTAEGFRMLQRPVKELETLRGKEMKHSGGTVAEVNGWLNGLQVPECFEVELELTIPAGGSAGLKLRRSASEETVVSADLGSQQISIDRRKSGRTDFHKKFPGTYVAPLDAKDGKVRLRILVDTSSVEVFGKDGEIVLTTLILPNPESRGVEIIGGDGVRVGPVAIWALAEK